MTTIAHWLKYCAWNGTLGSSLTSVLISDSLSKKCANVVSSFWPCVTVCKHHGQHSVWTEVSRTYQNSSLWKRQRVALWSFVNQRSKLVPRFANKTLPTMAVKLTVMTTMASSSETGTESMVFRFLKWLFTTLHLKHYFITQPPQLLQSSMFGGPTFWCKKRKRLMVF